MAASFTDSAGREWRLELDAAAVERYRERIGGEPHEGFYLLTGLLWILCERQQREFGMSDDDFADFIGTSCDDAILAVIEALGQAWPNAGQVATAGV